MLVKLRSDPKVRSTKVAATGITGEGLGADGEQYDTGK